MVLLLAGSLLYGIVYMYQEKNRSFLEQWEVVQVELFFEKLNRNGKCCLEDYVRLSEVLKHGDKNIVIRVEMYLGEPHYLLPWEEVQQVLSEKEIELETGSFVFVCVEKTTKKYSQRTIYRKVISGKG